MGIRLNWYPLGLNDWKWNRTTELRSNGMENSYRTDGRQAGRNGKIFFFVQSKPSPILYKKIGVPAWLPQYLIYQYC